MEDITHNEMLFVLAVFKSPEKEYNANSIAKILGISPMGALKIAKRLEKEDILKSRQVGKARIYKINMQSDYAKDYVKFLLKREAEQASPYAKVWIKELRKIKNADIAIMFGSALRKKDAKDIDAVLVTTQSRFTKLKKEIDEINEISIKRLHPLYQSKKDVVSNIKKRDKVLLNAIKGIVAFGENTFVELMEK